MKIITPLTITAACILFATTAVRAGGAPKGWIHAGSSPRDYDMSVDRGVAHGGNASGSVKCIAAKPEGFGTLMQTFKTSSFRGQRIRLSGYVRADNVDDWAGMWMRVDGPASGDLKMPNPSPSTTCSNAPSKAPPTGRSTRSSWMCRRVRKKLRLGFC